jgi:hypothetical protein
MELPGRTLFASKHILGKASPYYHQVHVQHEDIASSRSPRRAPESCVSQPFPQRTFSHRPLLPAAPLPPLPQARWAALHPWVRKWLLWLNLT